MEPLDFLTNEELLLFLHRKKTEISCIEQPHAFFTQLRDHDLMTEELFKKVKGIRSRDQKQTQKRIYEVLDRLEKEKPQHMHQFWHCVFENHIMQLYPTLRLLKNSLLDGTFKFYENATDVETQSDKSEGKEEKGKDKKHTRKRNKDDRNSEDSDGPGPSSASTPIKKKKKPAFSTPVKKDLEEIWNFPLYKTQLPVNCGDKEGTLYREKLRKGEKCILSNKQWFTPSDFEMFAGKERSKNWKLSIRCRNTPLKKLIEEKHLQCPPMERKRKSAPKNMREPSSESSAESSSTETSVISVEESDDEDFQEQRERGEGTEFRRRVEDEEEEEEEEEMTDLSVFQAPCLPVTRGLLTGTLYKVRFASGSRGKCIRTEESWFTPEEFVKEEPTLTDGHWKKNILCHGKTLNFLLKKEILRIHSLLCECVKCRPEDPMAQQNDDECYTCHSGGDLVCCDECPRAFHSHCHLPAVDGDSPGEWICTFCVFRTSQQWRDSSGMTKQQALNAPVSQFRLHCHYLLLRMYKEDTQKVFVKNPYQTVSRYSQFISQPMWLDKIKQDLESDKYQKVGAFVSDFQLLFRNCSTFNRDNQFGQMGARLSEMFEKEFKKIFSIQ